MNEIENAGAVEEQSANQQDAFLEGWGDEAPEAGQLADQQQDPDKDVREEPENGSDGAHADDEQTEQTETETTDEGVQTDTDAEGQKEAPKTWTLKHMGEERTLGVSDITPELLQKGLDYDRVRGKYDEAKPIMELFGQYARQANMSVADYVRRIREEAKRAGGMTAEEAKRTVELEDRETAVSIKEAAQQEGAQSKAERRAKVAADLAEFANAFPDIYTKAKSDPTIIPKSVWDEVNSGKFSLTAAYSRYAVSQAAQKAEAAEQVRQAAAQNQRNAQRSTGSQKSAGSDTKKSDAFLAGFDG